MALGLVRQLASGQHMQVRIPSGNYLWPAIRVLNPNDGIVYIKQNADLPDIGFGSWDYKVPSQSFGLLPGEGEGWQSVGMYYLDQSGANRPGEISVYLTQQNVNEPTFQSIGRAAVTLSSSVDIASGPQPSNPPAGYGRLWVDSNGSLHVLAPNGSDKTMLDTTTVFGTDVYGTYAGLRVQQLSGDANSLVHLNTPSYIVTSTGATITDYGRDGSGNPLIGMNGLTVTPGPTYLAGGGVNGSFYVSGNFSVSGTANITTLNTGNVSINGSLTANNAGNITISGAMNSTQVYITGNPPYLFFPDGTHYMIESGDYLYIRFPNGVLIQNSGGAWETLQCGVLNAFGNIGIQTASALYWPQSGNQQIYPSGTGLIVSASALGVSGTFRAGANTGFMSQFAAGVNWSSTTVNTWIATPLATSFTVNTGSSGSVLVSYSAIITSATVGTMMNVCCAMDGAISQYQINWVPVANQYMTISSTLAFTGLAPGTHTVTIYINANAGVYSLYSGAHNMLTVSGLMS